MYFFLLLLKFDNNYVPAPVICLNIFKLSLWQYFSSRDNHNIFFLFSLPRMPLSYFWTRNGLPMPPDAYMEDHNRVLVIPIAQVEDSGNYTCHVTRQNVLGDFKHFYLSIEGEYKIKIFYFYTFFIFSRELVSKVKALSLPMNIFYIC